MRVRPISLLRLSLLRFVDSNFQGKSLLTWEFHPLDLRFCLSQALWSPESWYGDWPHCLRVASAGEKWTTEGAVSDNPEWVGAGTSEPWGGNPVDVTCGWWWRWWWWWEQVDNGIGFRFRIELRNGGVDPYTNTTATCDWLSDSVMVSGPRFAIVWMGSGFRFRIELRNRMGLYLKLYGWDRV